MPNHVYNYLMTPTEKGRELLEEIYKNHRKSGGICSYYKPMPEELAGTTSPQRIPETISVEESTRLIALYGFADWYSWCNENWGTKWGCYDLRFEVDDDGVAELWYTSAWSPIKDSLIMNIVEEVGTLSYTWEEEQGFGEEVQFVDHEEKFSRVWGLPNWAEDSIDIKGVEYVELPTEHKGRYETLKAGYYTFDEDDLEPVFVAETLEELKLKVLDNS